MNNEMTDIILESISDGVFTVDLEWKITSFNKAAEKITGIDRSEAIGRSCWEVFKSNMCEARCPLRKTLKTKKPLINQPGYIINLNGKKVPVTVSTALLKDKNGKILGGAETFRDISEVEVLRNELKSRMHFGEMISNSKAMSHIFELLPVVSESTSTVLLQGESGTGKEVMARTIHSMGPRKNKPFIALNCGALPDNLLESELFGYKKGAFTGAEKDKPGRFALAKNGTLFLDEIGDISPALQVKLLRVLQEREFEPLGSIRTEKTDARIICATNRDLLKLVSEEKFRQDLFYRINVISIELPPLRDRKEDIPSLADHLLEKHAYIQNKVISSFHHDVMTLFYSYEWPGNIRELENVIERAVVLCPHRIIGIKYIPPEVSGIEPVVPGTANMHEMKNLSEKQIITRALRNNKYNRSRTARQLGIDKSTLYRKIKALQIELPPTDGRSALDE